jgi:polysaccharide export outer membrane protein
MLKSVWLVLAVLVLVGGCSSGSSPSGSAMAGSELGVLPASGTAQPAATAPPQGGTLVPAVVGLPPATSSSAATYLIGAGDLIQVDVFKVPDLSTKERVNEAGVIVMPLIGPVVVGGLTPEQAGRVIAAELAKDHLQNPQVNLLVLEYANMNITVGGAVKKPGVFPMKGQTTLLQAISLAEGINEVAKPEEVVVFRSLPGQPINAYVVDLKKVQRGDLADPVLAVNDKVMVPESGSAVFVKNMTGALRGFVSLNPLYY